MYEVDCPYCCCKQTIKYLEHEKFDHTCEFCEEEFEVEVECEYILIAGKIKNIQCPLCKETRRFEPITRFPVPKSLKSAYKIDYDKYQAICKSCWIKEAAKDL